MEDIFTESFDDIDIGLSDDSLEISDLRDNADVEYPCVLLTGVYMLSTIDMIEAIDKESSARVDAWIEIDRQFKKVCKITLKFPTIQLLRRCKIGLTIYSDKDNVSSIDLLKPEIVERFI